MIFYMTLLIMCMTCGTAMESVLYPSIIQKAGVPPVSAIIVITFILLVWRVCQVGSYANEVVTNDEVNKALEKQNDQVTDEVREEKRHDMQEVFDRELIVHGLKVKSIMYPILIHLVFVFTFAAISFKFRDDFQGINTFNDALYFSVITHTTVGYGDIGLRNPRAKVICMTHTMMVFLLFAASVQNYLTDFAPKEMFEDLNEARRSKGWFSWITSNKIRPQKRLESEQLEITV